MNAYLTDTHSHLYDSAFDGDRDEAVARAVRAGVGRIVLPAIDSASHGALFALCGEYPDVFLPMMGLHPTSVNDNPRWEEELALVEKHLARPPVERFYGVGEVGLDLHWSRDFLDRQVAVFERQIEFSLEYGLPLAIHTRDAWPQMVEVLSRYAGRGIKGIMHSFSGTYEDYETIKSFGDFVFGIGGVATYKKSAMAELAARMAPEDVVLETDCPYLTPEPFRGRRNESAYVTYVCEKVAEVTGRAPEEVARQTTRNAMRVLGI